MEHHCMIGDGCDDSIVRPVTWSKGGNMTRNTSTSKPKYVIS